MVFKDLCIIVILEESSLSIGRVKFFYICCTFSGPWFIGELLDGYVGVCFVFGLYVNGTFIPGDLTYLYGIFQVMSLSYLKPLLENKCNPFIFPIKM